MFFVLKICDRSGAAVCEGGEEQMPHFEKTGIVIPLSVVN
jgi:hypothetical protein